MEKEFREGQLVAYCPTDVDGNIYRVEIGEVKRVGEDKSGKFAFVYYHEGDTAARTSYRDLYPIQNAYCIKETTIAKERWEDE